MLNQSRMCGLVLPNARNQPNHGPVTNPAGCLCSCMLVFRFLIWSSWLSYTLLFKQLDKRLALITCVFIVTECLRYSPYLVTKCDYDTSKQRTRPCISDAWKVRLLTVASVHECRVACLVIQCAKSSSMASEELFHRSHLLTILAPTSNCL